ncbi:MAG: hypothetical protein ACYDB7_15440 [Mycobacteriales bacterium]
MIVLIICAVVLTVAAWSVIAANRRTDALSEVERFHRARAMTTAWSREHRPALVPPTAHREMANREE